VRSILALDGLRGLAVLIVLASHMANAGLPVLPGFSLSGIGKSGVYLFFVLSAYLLTRILLTKPASQWRTPTTWLDYALRRVLRIWPLYLVVLLVSACLTAWGALPWWPYALDGMALVRHLMLVEGTSVLWSIPVEFHYYLWLPLVTLGLALAQRAGGLVGSGIFAVLCCAAALWLWPPAATLVNDVRLGPYLTLFFSGAFAAAVSVALTQARWRPLVWSMVGACAVLLLLLTTPVLWALVAGQAFQPDLNHGWFPFFGLVWSALLLAVVHGQGAWQKPFEWAPMRWAGRVSFSAYLWHMPVLAAVLGPLDLAGWPAAAAFVAGTALVAELSYRCFEKPFQGLRWRGAALPVAGRDAS